MAPHYPHEGKLTLIIVPLTSRPFHLLFHLHVCLSMRCLPDELLVLLLDSASAFQKASIFSSYVSFPETSPSFSYTTLYSVYNSIETVTPYYSIHSES